MYDDAARARAMELLATGRSLSSVSRELSIARSTLRAWRDGAGRARRAEGCPRCGDSDIDAASYAAMLGFYLGDGVISRQRSTYSLRVSCDMRYPAIVDDVASLVVAVRGRGPVGRVRAPGCIVVSAYWNHWTCLFPQHGPGRKHERTLVLEPWQQAVLEEHPAPFLRGLFHSDGCRVDNWATRTVAGEKRVYFYGRWQFVNHSPEIRQWCDLRRSTGWGSAGGSRRGRRCPSRGARGVALLDELVGAKC